LKRTQSKAVALALDHVEAWSNHDYERARKGLAPDVHVISTSTMEGLPRTDLRGVDEYMEGLIKFADPIKSGSLEINHSVGDDLNALLIMTVKIEGPPFGSAILQGARLYRFDENDKIKAEQVVFYVMAD